MTTENGGSISSRSADIAQLSTLSDSALNALLAEWKRWRARVQTEAVMRFRQQRYDEATLFIRAIEEEVTLRQPQARARARKQAADTVHALASAQLVSLTDYRTARQTLSRLEHRRLR